MTVPATPLFALFTLALLATGLMRLAELAVSVRRIRARPTAAVSEPWLFPLMALLHTGLVVAPLAEVVLLGRAAHPALFGAASAVLVLATVLRVWTLRTIGRSWNVRVVVPASDAIAATGPYRWIRHPNYLVVILEIAALPLLHGAWLAAVGLSALNAFVLFHRIRTEEAALAQVPAWVAVMGDKKRLVPGIL